VLQEFCQVLDHFDIPLVEVKRRLLFARVDRSGDGRIGYREFEDAFHLLQDMIVERHLEQAGFTRARLLLLLMYSIVVLGLIFVFIFVGVAAFTGVGTIGAVVSSLMTAGAGIAMNLKESLKAKESEKKPVVDTE
jgi:hypothetical protein